MHSSGLLDDNLFLALLSLFLGASNCPIAGLLWPLQPNVEVKGSVGLLVCLLVSVCSPFEQST